MGGVQRVEQRTDTLTHWVTSVNGVHREFDAEITEQIPDERVAWTTLSGEDRQGGVVTFHRLDGDRPCQCDRPCRGGRVPGDQSTSKV